MSQLDCGVPTSAKTYVDVAEVFGADETGGSDAGPALAKASAALSDPRSGQVARLRPGTYSIRSNQTLGPCVWTAPGDAGAAVVTLQGTRTNLYAGTAQAGTLPWVAGIVGSGGQYGIIVDAGVPTGAWSTSGLEGKHFSMTTGANAGQVGVIIAEVPGNPTHAYYLPTQQQNAVPTNGNPSVGDTYEVYSIPTLTGWFKIADGSSIACTDLEFVNTNPNGNVIEAQGPALLSTFGCHFKGPACIITDGYWLSSACSFEIATGLEASNGGFFDNWGNLFLGTGMLLVNGGNSDNFGNTVVFGAAGNPNYSLALSSNLRFPFGVPASWLCFCETPGCAVFLESGSTITCESERIWGHLTGAPSSAVTITEGGKFFYNSAVAPCQLSGSARLVNIAGTGYFANQLPVNATPQGAMWDANLAPPASDATYLNSMLDLPGCVLLLDANLGIHTTAGNVDTWNDQSVTGYNVTQAVAGQRPVYNAVDAAYNGQATLSFLHANSTVLTKAASLALAQPCTWYIVGEETLTTGGFIDGAQAIYSGTGTASALGLYASATFESGVAGQINTKCAIAAVMNKNQSQGFVNDWDPAHATPLSGDALSSSTGPGTATQTQVYVGGANVSVFPMTGKIALVAAYTGAHTAAQRQQAIQYLANRYAITAAP